MGDTSRIFRLSRQPGLVVGVFAFLALSLNGTALANPARGTTSHPALCRGLGADRCRRLLLVYGVGAVPTETIRRKLYLAGGCKSETDRRCTILLVPASGQ